MLNVETISAFERQYLSLEANTVDEVSEWVSRRHKGFRSSPLGKLPKGPMARFARAAIDDISFVNFRWHQAFQSEILEDLDAYFICVPHAGQMKMQFAHDDEVVQTTEQLRVFKRQAGLTNIVGPGYSNLSLIIPAALMEKRLEQWTDGHVNKELEFFPLVKADGGPGGPIVSVVSHVLSLFNTAPDCLENELIRTNIKEHLMSVVFECLPHSYHEASQRLMDGVPRSVRRAEEYMRAHCDQPITVADLAKAAGCSERGLQAAFKSHRQAGPMAVLRDIRLEAARNDILHTDDTVTDIAFKWGFSHLGRFSKLFADKYGETPSRVARISG